MSVLTDSLKSTLDFKKDVVKITLNDVETNRATTTEVVDVYIKRTQAIRDAMINCVGALEVVNPKDQTLTILNQLLGM